MIWTEERQKIARASLARWQGTPHHNRIARPGVGIDCIKLVYEVCIDAGIFERSDFSGYDLKAGMYGESSKLQETILQCVNGDLVFPPWQFGDIAITRTGNRSAHCGFIDPPHLWHSLAGRCVTRSDLAQWGREIVCAVRLTGLGFKAHPSRII